MIPFTAAWCSVHVASGFLIVWTVKRLWHICALQIWQRDTLLPDPCSEMHIHALAVGKHIQDEMMTLRNPPTTSNFWRPAEHHIHRVNQELVCSQQNWPNTWIYQDPARLKMLPATGLFCSQAILQQSGTLSVAAPPSATKGRGRQRCRLNARSTPNILMPDCLLLVYASCLRFDGE